MNVSCLRAGAIGEPVRAVGVTDKRRQSALDTPTAAKGLGRLRESGGIPACDTHRYIWVGVRAVWTSHERVYRTMAPYRVWNPRAKAVLIRSI